MTIGDMDIFGLQKSIGLVSALSSNGEISIHNELSNNELSNYTNIVLFGISVWCKNEL